MTDRAFIALGSNLDHPRAQIERAIAAISALPHTVLCDVSPFYKTKPMGYAEQDDFVNAVICIETALTPMDLLAQLQKIEQAQGRVRDIKNGPRTIDCDMVLFGDVIMNTPALTLPHPGLTTRDFVLKPLLDIAPECTLPQGAALKTFLNTLDSCYCVAEVLGDADVVL